jgi:putative ABC transport system ATP-binding protein
MKLLVADNISHSFEYELFSNISLTLSSNESIAIIGESGSGKSTFLHILSTFLKPNSGSVELFGKDISKLKQKELMQIKRNKLGLIFQAHYLFKGFSAYENLEIASILSDKIVDNELLEKLDIQKVIKQKVTELSGGQQQRVSIARVLIKKPKIIFADEPTGNLDRKTAINVMNILLDYIEKNLAGMILVTHDEELAKMCKFIYKIENQKLIQIK